MSNIKSLAELQEIYSNEYSEYLMICIAVDDGFSYERYLEYEENYICSEHDFNSLIDLTKNGYDIYNINELTGDKNEHLAWLTALNDMRNDPIFNDEDYLTARAPKPINRNWPHA